MCFSATDKPQRATGSRQHIRCIMLQACSQAHNIKNNKQSDGCLEHFVFYIGLKGNHNSNMANITSYKRLFPYKKLWPLPATGAGATPVRHSIIVSSEGTIWNHLTFPEVQLCSLPKQQILLSLEVYHENARFTPETTQEHLRQINTCYSSWNKCFLKEHPVQRLFITKSASGKETLRGCRKNRQYSLQSGNRPLSQQLTEQPTSCACKMLPTHLNATVPEESTFLHTVQHVLLTARLSGPQAKESMQPATQMKFYHTLHEVSGNRYRLPKQHKRVAEMRTFTSQQLQRITVAGTYGIFPVVLAITALLPRSYSLGYNFPKHTFGSFNDREFRASSET